MWHRNFSSKGQSLVEFAIVAPLLLLMMLGVLEFGILLRSYIELVNAGREGARFAAKFGDYGGFFPETRYDAIRDQALGALSYGSRVDHDFLEHGTIIVTFIDVSGGSLCEAWHGDPVQDAHRLDYNPPCNCLAATPPFTAATLRYPTQTQWLTMTRSYGLTETHSTRISPTREAADMAQLHLRDNCIKEKYTPQFVQRGRMRVYVEMFFDHRLVFGIPYTSLAKQYTIYTMAPFPVFAPVRGKGGIDE